MLGLGYFFRFLILYTTGRTTWNGWSARRKAAAYSQDNTITEQTHIDIHASSRIWILEPRIQAGEDSSYLRPRSHCDRHQIIN
jgi:hypothetical protein